MRYFGRNIKLIVNNLVISYTDEGLDEAPVIIFIHGFPLNKSMWDKQMEALLVNHRVIAYDIRGHGDSDTGNQDFSIDLFVKDLLAFMDLLKIDKASLCGLSMGGYIALNAVENFPERFEALVLSDTQCLPDSPEAKEKRLKAIENIKQNSVEKYATDSIINLFAPDSFKSKTAETILVKDMIVNTSELSLCNTLLALYNRNETCSKLSKINIPVLIMVGEEDVITPLASAQQMHEKIKDSILYAIDQAGHLSNLENAEEFNNHLKEFFATVYKVQQNTNTIGENSILKELRNKLNMILSFRSI